MGSLPKAVQLLEKTWTVSPLMQKIYSAPYRLIVGREVKLAGIKEGDRILSLGCGAIPFTAIFLHQLTGNPVTAIDIDPVALEKAQGLLGQKRLTGIRLMAANGALVDLSGFSVIITALQAEPKEKILANFFQTAPRGARIVFRVPRGIFSSSYDSLPGGYKPEKEITQPMLTFGKSVLFRAGESS